MWQYEKKLQFPVNIKNTNPAMARLIISQYGGPDGEIGASLRYLSQRYAMPYPELKAILTDIGIEDLFCAYIKVFVVSPSRADFVRSIHPFRSLPPKNQGFETQLVVSFQKVYVIIFTMFYTMLNLRFNFKKCKREQSRVE